MAEPLANDKVPGDIGAAARPRTSTGGSRGSRGKKGFDMGLSIDVFNGNETPSSDINTSDVSSPFSDYTSLVVSVSAVSTNQAKEPIPSSLSVNRALTRLYSATNNLTSNILVNGMFPSYLYEDLGDIYPELRTTNKEKGKVNGANNSSNGDNKKSVSGSSKVSSIFYETDSSNSLLDADLRMLRIEPKTLVNRVPSSGSSGDSLSRGSLVNSQPPQIEAYQLGCDVPHFKSLVESREVSDILYQPSVFTVEDRVSLRKSLEVNQRFVVICNNYRNAIELGYPDDVPSAFITAKSDAPLASNDLQANANKSHAKPIRVVLLPDELFSISHQKSGRAIEKKSNSSIRDPENANKIARFYEIFAAIADMTARKVLLAESVLAKKAAAMLVSWSISVIQTRWRVALAQKYGPLSRHYLVGERLPLNKAHVVRCCRQVSLDLIRSKMPQVFFEVDSSSSTISSDNSHDNEQQQLEQRKTLYVDVFSLLPSYIMEYSKLDTRNRTVLTPEQAFFYTYMDVPPNSAQQQGKYFFGRNEKMAHIVRDYISRSIKKIFERYERIMRSVPLSSVYTTSSSNFSKPNPFSHVSQGIGGARVYDKRNIRLVPIEEMDETEAATIIKVNRNVRKNVLRIFNEQFLEINGRQPYKSEKEILRPLYTEYKRLGKDGILEASSDSKSVISNVSSFSTSTSKIPVLDLTEISSAITVSDQSTSDQQKLGKANSDSIVTILTPTSINQKEESAQISAVAEKTEVSELLAKLNSKRGRSDNSNSKGTPSEQSSDKAKLSSERVEKIPIHDLKTLISETKLKVEALCEHSFTAMRKTIPSDSKNLKVFKKDIQKILFNLKEEYEYIHMLVDVYKKRRDGDFPPGLVSGWSQQYAETYHLLFSAYTKVKERLASMQE